MLLRQSWKLNQKFPKLWKRNFCAIIIFPLGLSKIQNSISAQRSFMATLLPGMFMSVGKQYVCNFVCEVMEGIKCMCVCLRARERERDPSGHRWQIKSNSLCFLPVLLFSLPLCTCEPHTHCSEMSSRAWQTDVTCLLVTKDSLYNPEEKFSEQAVTNYFFLYCYCYHLFIIVIIHHRVKK